MSAELKPCPLCGGSAKIVHIGNVPAVEIECQACNCRGPWFQLGKVEDSELFASEAWNTRATTEADRMIASLQQTIAGIDRESDRLRLALQTTGQVAQQAWKGSEEKYELIRDMTRALRDCAACMSELQQLPIVLEIIANARAAIAKAEVAQ